MKNHIIAGLLVIILVLSSLLYKECKSVIHKLALAPASSLSAYCSKRKCEFCGDSGWITIWTNPFSCEGFFDQRCVCCGGPPIGEVERKSILISKGEYSGIINGVYCRNWKEVSQDMNNGVDRRELS